MIITPTLHFHGQCEEAIKLYQKAFNCRVDHLLHYSDADKRDWDAELTDDEKNYVYHSEVYFGEQRLMMADELGFEQKANNMMFLGITFDTKEEVKRAFEVLLDGATVVYPMRSTTYSSCMGSLIDKFGVRWGLMTEQTER